MNLMRSVFAALFGAAILAVPDTTVACKCHAAPSEMQLCPEVKDDLAGQLDLLDFDASAIEV